MVASLALASARAITPDQLLPYVAAVSGLESEIIGDCLLHRADGDAVLVAYPLSNPLDGNAREEAVRLACQMLGLRRISVLSPAPLANPPQNASIETDAYWRIPIDNFRPGQKLANTLRRAGREVAVRAQSGKGAYAAEHEKLTTDFIKLKSGELAEGTKYLFGQLQAYLENVPEALLFEARDHSGALAAFAIGDFTALATAFYMFAFRKPDAPPGAADLLIEAMLREGKKRGHEFLNLGLGINPGIRFFKQKWGATAHLPYVETSWELPRAPKKKNWLKRLFGARES